MRPAHATTSPAGEEKPRLPAAPASRPPATRRALSTAQRVLAALVASGTAVIAGIGFAGSYAAVRALALQKGFGNFAYVFPVGIDAGICVLLALDLLLTWIRIPFPLLRQTAWLLTVATIAFNGAAAWPDPLGVGMHAVIPVLFVVSVEAARHAIGRIADITADKHMEGVRITRWLLSPLPTFLLWRRMKLWELRSYDQVIKLEQERLVYQARLRSRFGRAWRRKAPVESLMPLRLARYGVPLAQTAANGLAAAGIEPAVRNTRAELPPDHHQGPAPGAVPHTEAEPHAIRTESAEPTPKGENRPAPRTSHHARPDTGAVHGPLDAHPHRPAPRRSASRGPYQHPDDNGRHVPYRRPPEPPTTASSRPIARSAPPAAAEQTATWTGFGAHPMPTPTPPRLLRLERSAPTGPISPGNRAAGHGSPAPRPTHGTAARSVLRPDPPGLTPSASRLTAPSVDRRDPATPAVGSAVGEATYRPRGEQDPAQGEEPEQPRTEARVQLTVVDRYYLAWNDYRRQHHTDPDGNQLSAYLADHGIHGRSGQPVSPSTLRRYLLSFRIYTIWVRHRRQHITPDPVAIADECTSHGIAGQYNVPLATPDITRLTPVFEQRWNALSQHRPQLSPCCPTLQDLPPADTSPQRHQQRSEGTRSHPTA